MRLLFVDRFFSSNHPWLEVLFKIACVAVFSGLPVAFVYRSLYRSGWFSFTVVYLGLIQLLNLFAVLLAIAYSELTGSPIPIINRVNSEATFMYPHYLAFASALGMICTWTICRSIYGKVILQDGTKCPGCGYTVIGSFAQICPECGREYTKQELGIHRHAARCATATAARRLPGAV